MTTASDDLVELRKLAEEARKVAPGFWEIDTEEQTDLSPRHQEYAVFDGRGYRMFGTENADYRFGEIQSDGPDEYGNFNNWNEPSRLVMEFAVAVSPLRIIALLDALEAKDTEIERLKAFRQSAVVAGKKLADQRDRAVEALRMHHQWHCRQEDYAVPDGEGGYIELNHAEEYSDSAMCEKTLAALVSLKEADND